MTTHEPTSRRKAIRIRPRNDASDHSIQSTATELWQLILGYAKQEIKDPLDGAWRYLAYGIGSMFLVGVGSVLLALSALRALQTETGSMFQGNLSWLPYLIVLAGAAALTGIVALILVKRKDPK